MVLNLGIIGTNWITNQFVDAAIATQEYQLVGVYSRSIEKAKSFGVPYQATVFETSLEAFATNSDIDVVYIASPNSMHYEQAITLMEAGKHVIVEKPIFSNPREWVDAARVAEENKVFLFEAARHVHEENFKIVKEEVKSLENMQGATFTYMKYSSRYDAVLRGEEPNIFSLDFSGGALADLGVYPLYAALAWFGVPETSHYFCTKIATGVDGKGTIILRYKEFDVTILTGKIVNSFLPAEIYGLNKTLSMDSIESITTIDVIDCRTKLKESIAKKTSENPMMDEAKDFADVINFPEDINKQKEYKEWLTLSQQVNQLMTNLRKDAGIVFAADKR
ncbi:Gfo/Idh/MocA family oxidoreductase [Carnobacterium sp. ISL-102]|uniref:Gfo/Idh/MocA family protein n=1 Tax=Carnobacterium sp. ISL-102 TaxID=2819142 RepID=UPI001BEACA22|nr:Gfo/Idh/MocA family oxidoreductase [Carnobacterium sp. ISL-102]MBT2731127.1 Gfo/Idh/MocA family oxidoreductase [Carnobacterium sp. ISL-102]